MNGVDQTDPAKRQVLVNIGNRHVVFGPDGGLPEPIRFNPTDSEIQPRVADESEGSEFRIVESLQVSGMTRIGPWLEAIGNADIGFDIGLADPIGTRILIDIKVRAGDPKQRDLKAATEKLKRAKLEGLNLEVWFFNIDRIKLTVIRFDGTTLRVDKFVPLNIWEKTSEGIFERQRVVEEVEDWLHRVEAVYGQVREWLADKGDLRFDQTRSVTMSEEIMQNFAVTDREIAILDVLHGDQVAASFVPRGLWTIGAWGRIDVITTDQTFMLVAIKTADDFEWKLVSPADRRQMRVFDRTALLELMGGQ